MGAPLGRTYIASGVRQASMAVWQALGAGAT